MKLTMIMIKAVGTVLALATYFLWLPFPGILIALVPYYFVARHRVGHWLNPFVKSDIALPLVISLVWVTVGLMSLGGKSLANLVELFLLGIVWLLLWMVRLTLICITRRKPESFCFYANCALVVIAVLSALFFPALPE